LTKTVKGLDKLSAEDLRQGRKFEDGIRRVRFNVDIHALQAADEIGNLSENVISKPYQIPYRSLVAADVDPSGIGGALRKRRLLGACLVSGDGKFRTDGRGRRIRRGDRRETGMYAGRNKPRRFIRLYEPARARVVSRRQPSFYEPALSLKGRRGY